jgi:hypothetical protein
VHLDARRGCSPATRNRSFNGLGQNGFSAFAKTGADLLPGSGSAAMSIPARPFYEQAAKLLVRRFRREGGDNFLEARVAAQRVPFGIEA